MKVWRFAIFSWNIWKNINMNICKLVDDVLVSQLSVEYATFKILIFWYFFNLPFMYEKSLLFILNNDYFARSIVIRWGLRFSAASESKLSNPNPSPSPSHHLQIWIRIRVRVWVITSESESSSPSQFFFSSPSHESSSPHIQYFFIFQNMKTNWIFLTPSFISINYQYCMNNNKNVSNVNRLEKAQHGQAATAWTWTESQVTISDSKSRTK